MPYEKRHTASELSLRHRQRSRRRIAAVSFLSNISLDGTHHDTNLRHFVHISKTAKDQEKDANKRDLQDFCKESYKFVNNELISSEQNELTAIKSKRKNARVEKLGDFHIHGSKAIQGCKHSLPSLVKNKSQSNQSSPDLENGIKFTEDDSQSINITVNKSYNSNIVTKLGNLDALSVTGNVPSVHCSNLKHSNISNTLERAGKHVVTRVRSITARSSLARSSIGSSDTSLTCSVVQEDDSRGKKLVAPSSLADKENIGPGDLYMAAYDSKEWERTEKDKASTHQCMQSSNPLSAAGGGSDKVFSSCESLGAALGATGLHRIRKASSSVSECSTAPAQLKYIRGMGAAGAALIRHTAEGRLLITTGRGPPIHIFSLGRERVLSVGGVRGSGVGESLPRKRNVSGSRQLPTITDADTDPLRHYSPTGGSAGSKMQEVSYSNLLVSSPYFAVGRRRQNPYQSTSEDRSSVIQLTQLLCHHNPQQHPTSLGRCISLDPTMTTGTAAALEPSLPSKPSNSLSQSAIAGLAGECLVGIGGIGIGGQPMGVLHAATRPAGCMDTCYPYPNYSFAPELLDDPELHAGKHRKLLRFPSYMTSLIDYAKPDDLKREVNDKFRNKFPHVKITLSKLRSLKREMVHICKEAFSSTAASSTSTVSNPSSTNPGSNNNNTSKCSALLTVAYAHAYFDSLCLSGAVQKTSRKPLAGACIMISAKMNDVKGEVLAALVERTECQLRVERSELVHSELTALLSLQFSLHLPTQHLNGHYQRLLFEH